MSRIGVTGHQQLTPPVATEIAHRLRLLFHEQGESLIGVTSLAAGADQLFARIVLAVGGAIEVILPSRLYRTTFDNQSDLTTFDALLARARTISTLPFNEPSEEAFMEAGREIVRHCERLVAIWDGQPARGLGGTSDVVAFARQRGLPVHVIWPEGVARE